ncbi:MAG: DUF1080 domain-containing protein, partial [Phycisphaerae bacterium]|nr:DUF1080 domain-containing protein [Phycisphaerae bacterium]
MLATFTLMIAQAAAPPAVPPAVPPPPPASAPPAAAPAPADPPALQPAAPRQPRGGLPPGVRAHGVRVQSMTEGADPPGMDGKGVRLFVGPWLGSWTAVHQADKAGNTPAPERVTLVLDASGALLLDRDYATAQEFGDAQIHLEFRIPPLRDGSSACYAELKLAQGCRIVMTDSMNRPQRPNSCGAILDIAAPTTSASLPPGAWQTFDVAYRAARAAAD